MFVLSPFSRPALAQTFWDWIFPVLDTPLPLDETEDGITLSLDLPGYDKDSISVLLQEDVLKVEAIRQTKSRNGSSNQKYLEQFVVPSSVDLETIDVEYKDGVLTIKGKKTEASKPKKIEVK